MHEKITWLKREAEKELSNILEYWSRYAIDEKFGGFVGRIDEDNVVDKEAPKGSVLNARILWTFSAAGKMELADRAFEYFQSHFIDKEYGGVYWTVSYDGRPLDDKKQIYACAFAVYALAEYYIASGREAAKEHALDIYRTVIAHAHDAVDGGFYEAFSVDWRELQDQRLSAKDANEKKTTNTNLHVLEAFANLYRIYPDQHLRALCIELLSLFNKKIIDQDTGHLRLFFDEQWNNRPDVISYGHDIEAAWLLLDCARVVGDDAMIDVFTHRSLLLADAAMKGLDDDGGLWYEYNLRTGTMIYEKHWWPQAEAVVGFLNAYQLSGDSKYLEAAVNCWQFIASSLLHPKGEWYWGIDKKGLPMPGQDKAGLWKCPYHNGRAMLRIL